jgi:hypothetical protein
MDNKQAFARFTKLVTIEQKIVRPAPFRFRRVDVALSSSPSALTSLHPQLTYRLCARELGVTVKDAKTYAVFRVSFDISS